MTITNILLVGIGGIFGAIVRYFIAVACVRWIAVGFPVATLIANVTGCFLMGALLGGMSTAEGPSRQVEALRLSLGIGFLGSLTTFSTFSADTIAQLQQGQYGSALVYVSLNLVLGLMAVVVGISLGARLRG